MKLIYCIIIIIICVGCNTVCTNEYQIRNANVYSKDSRYCMYLADSIRADNYVILASENNHLFLVPNSSLFLVTDETTERSIFQISGAGFFSWEVEDVIMMPPEGTQKYLYSGRTELWQQYSNVDLLSIYKVEAKPFVRHFDIVSCKIMPEIFYLFLVRGVAYYQWLTSYDIWGIFTIYRQAAGAVRVFNTKKFKNIDFVAPYAYYPVYVPMLGYEQQYP